jgi:hypothetical protein
LAAVLNLDRSKSLEEISSEQKQKRHQKSLERVVTNHRDGDVRVTN